MQFYLAPLEGITGHVFREAYDRIFHDIDKYFTPFLSANDHLNNKTTRELGIAEGQDAPGLLQAPLVPQILGNEADRVVRLAEEIRDLTNPAEINLNFGCPSGTVTGKNRGSGIFKDLIAMDDLLDRLFAGFQSSPSLQGVKISLKTRIGWSDEKEWEQIVRIYADYPFSEIIIHPRVRADQYKGACRTEAFAYAREHLQVPLCYNGDIRSVEDYMELCKLFPGLDRVMIGRGIVADPLLVSRLSALPDLVFGDEEIPPAERKKRHDFVRALEEGYLSSMQCEEHAVMRMKEFWLYFGNSFPGYERAKKAIKKAATLSEYRLACAQIPW
ncbi:MAG: tRNA-dihydrouridine synthase family protein [Lachnospiraceae bacterium]|nr:tRNA-dihydrouridine synthase family protein [Lachnospiraceae bacterium]